jgi:eukaryotic-like serine/threonine-protein kinase
MSLIGNKLGPYEITGAIGAGGMGEVYRARDTRLGRDVALKVLPEAFARDAERMARFRREAQVLASLNHPNIAAIYGFEDSGGAHALVMELVEGPTLAERIGRPNGSSVSTAMKSFRTRAVAKGALALDEALPIAKQMCEALEYAHERGIVHRDLKPANVKVTTDDAVKVLDFGLAKAIEGDASSMDMANSPTLSRMATQAGIILGTAAYMSPEQAKGKAVDRRADIWAFGCVLYEMLTGKMAFHGETVSDTLAAVIRDEPDWSLLPAETPARVQVLLQRCLQKDPKQRLRDIGEGRIAIDEVLSVEATAQAASSGGVPFAKDVQDKKPAAQKSGTAFPWAITGVTILIAGLFAILYFSRSPQQISVDAYILPPTNTSFTLTNDDAAGPIVLSKDGKQIAFVAEDENGKTHLYVQSLADRDAHMIPDTERAEYPFWSPDGESLGFFSNGKLRRVAVNGGPPLDICDAVRMRGGAWLPDNSILFVPDISSGIFRVSANPGSTPVQITKTSAARDTNRWPNALPDGKHFLYLATSHSNPEASAQNGIYFASINGKEKHFVMPAESNAVYAGGRLLYVQGGVLLARPFDPSTGKVSGQAAALAENVGFNVSSWRAAFDANSDGTLTYQPDTGPGAVKLLVLNREGKVEQTINEASPISNVRFSPDGHDIAIQTRGGAAGYNIWILNLEKGTSMRFTFGGYTVEGFAWSRDGHQLYYVSMVSSPTENSAPTYQLHRKSVNGAGTDNILFESVNRIYVSSVSPDENELLFLQPYQTLPTTTWIRDLSSEAKPRPLFGELLGALHASFSPDGEWALYASTETGRYELYAFSLRTGTRQQLTSSGALYSSWRADSKSIDYSTEDGSVYELPVSETSGSLAAGTPRLLFKTHIPSSLQATWQLWSATQDGQHFIVGTNGEQSNGSVAEILTDWQAALKQLQ